MKNRDNVMKLSMPQKIFTFYFHRNIHFKYFEIRLYGNFCNRNFRNFFQHLITLSHSPLSITGLKVLKQAS